MEIYIFGGMKKREGRMCMILKSSADKWIGSEENMEECI